MKLLFSSPSASEAGLLKSLLDEAGIASEIRNEYTYSNFPGASFQPEIWVVNDKDFEYACELREGWWSQSGGPNLPQEASTENQIRRSTMVFSALTCLLCLILGLLSLTRFARAGERRHLAGCILLGFLSVGMGWMAIGIWLTRRRRTRNEAIDQIAEPDVPPNAGSAPP